MSQFPAFVATPEIRWSDQDILGHVNNARIVTLVEQSRILWLHSFKKLGIIDRPKLVARVELNYRSPVMYGSELRVELGIGHVGNTSFTITNRGIQNGKLAFEGLNTLVVMDKQGEKPLPFSAEERTFLSQFGTFDPKNPAEGIS